MDAAALTTLFDTVGTAGIYLYACWYLMKRMEARESERAAESKEREARLIVTLEHTETYIRETLAVQLHQNNQALQDSTAAMRALTRAFEDVPCRNLPLEAIEAARDRHYEDRKNSRPGE